MSLYLLVVVLDYMFIWSFVSFAYNIFIKLWFFVLDSFRREETSRPRMWTNEVSCTRSGKYVI